MSEDAKDFFNQAMTTAFSQGYDKGYDTGYNEGYETAWNEHIRPADARKADGKEKVPLEELRAEIGGLQDCIDDLYDRVKRLESVVFYGGKKA